MTITVDDMVRREVYYCVSSLISDLMSILPSVDYRALKNTSLDYDELLGLCRSQDYEQPAREHIDEMGRDELVEALADADVEDERDYEEIATALAAAMLDYDDEVDDLPTWPGVSDDDLKLILKDHWNSEVDGWQTFCQEFSLEPEEDEVYEHWIISDWLAGRLRDKGYTVGEVSGLTIWGRGCTGQAISQDWVMQQIHAELIAD